MSEKKKVAGVVDRVEGDIAVVVVKDPNDGINKEIYVDKKKLKKVDLKEGDHVTVEMSMITFETKIPLGGSMLESEDNIEKALEQMKKKALKKNEPNKKVPVKRPKKA